ncbi:hypothetical protein UlMin_009226 [Ulmus minor]
MDTPERNQIGAPVSKVEDSPVFNFINNLSPIKPVKSLHITQTFNTFSFASLPSVFTSPHVTSQKESRILRRYNLSDSSKPELDSENGGKISTNEGAVADTGQLYNNQEELHENCDSMVNIEEASLEPNAELPTTLKYDCGSPDCVSTPCSGEADSASELADPSCSVVPHVPEETSERGLSDGQIEQKKEGEVCDWESLICDGSDILIFNSPNGAEAFRGLMPNSLERIAKFMGQFPENDVNDQCQMQIIGPVGSSEHHRIEGAFSQPGEASHLMEIDQTQDRFTNTSANEGELDNSGEKRDSEVETGMAFSCKSVFNLHRGIRRRCLDFEMVGARRKNLEDGSNSSSSSLTQADENISSSDRQRCIIPGIGLHLNALASTSRDCKIITNENMSGIQIRLPNSNISVHSPSASQDPPEKSLVLVTSERDVNAPENGVQLLQDASQATGSLANEESNQNSPKKKRRRMENEGETEGCKRCNCKKSKCLKLYCECFAAGVYCIEPCSCQECFNKPIHEDTVLATRKQIESRNPLAFAPKVIRSSDSIPEYGDEPNKTPASARHKRGCNCKKSNCLKKYCECYQGGVGCSIGCRCEGCKNAFGRKDGSAMIGTEPEPDEEETDASQTSKIEIQNNKEQNPSSTVAITPLSFSRTLAPLPYSSKGKPPRSSFITVASSSSSLYSSQKNGRPTILRSQTTKFEKHIQTIPDDEMPEILRVDRSPTTGIKTSSPNSKRISPPHCYGSSLSSSSASPSRRSGRKLILQSIPSFPSLTQQ